MALYRETLANKFTALGIIDYIFVVLGVGIFNDAPACTRQLHDYEDGFAVCWCSSVRADCQLYRPSRHAGDDIFRCILYKCRME